MPSSIDIYIEAVCLNSPGIAGWGAFISDGTAHRKLHGGNPESDHNCMSMTAAIAALEELEDSYEVRLYTDSKYLCDGITNWIKSWEKRDWRTKAGKPVKNVDLWKRLQEASGKHQVEWLWSPKQSGGIFHKLLREQAEAIALAEQGLKEHLPPDHELLKKW